MVIFDSYVKLPEGIALKNHPKNWYKPILSYFINRWFISYTGYQDISNFKTIQSWWLIGFLPPIHRTVAALCCARQVILGVPRPRAQSFLDGILQGFFGLARGPMDL